MKQTAAILIVGALALVSCGEANTTATTTSVAVPATTSAPSLSTLTLGVEATTTTTAEPTTTVSEDTPDFRVVVVDGTVDGGGLLEIELGSEVTIDVISDVDDEAHLHGYSISVEVGPARSGRLVFTADIPGVFELELEEAGLEVARVQVAP